MGRYILSVVVIGMVCCVRSGHVVMEADTIFINGDIYTLDPTEPKAQAIVCKGGRIIFVGSVGGARRYRAKEVIDLKGRVVVPGFVDAHGHLQSLGALLISTLDLTRTRSYQELLDVVSKRVKEVGKGEWIIGRGWNHENWDPKELPTHERLSQITPENPVWLVRVDGHAGLANRKAMQLAGVTRQTEDPDGGKIWRNDVGEPTGVFVDAAIKYITDCIPEATPQQVERELLAAQDECLRLGLTGVHDAGIGEVTLKVLQRLAREGRLKLRVYAMLCELPEGEPIRVGIGDNRLTVRSVKLFADGALGSRGAWLLEPYSDYPRDQDGNPYYGLRGCDPRDIYRVAVKALRSGWQLCVHAIGDRANRRVLDAFRDALRDVPVSDHRFRIEHAQIVHPDDIPRFAGLGVIASMQPIHATSDMWMALRRLGEGRLEGAYAWRKFLRSGARVAAGSDFPIESANPLWGFYAAITRQDHQGRPEGGWLPGERMSRQEALRCFTIEACYAAFQEQVKGTLQAGKYADFVVLSRDIMKIEPREILATEVLLTVINGEVVYRR